MAPQFKDRVVLITGAGKGLDRAYAIWLAERGANVIVNNRSHPDTPSSADAVVEEIRASGGTAIADYHSVEDKAAGQAMVNAAVAQFGKIDTLICNAGGVDDMPSSTCRWIRCAGSWTSTSGQALI